MQAGASRADILIYGGAAGGGKSHWLLTEAARHHAISGYVAKIFRRLSTQIKGGGGLWDKSFQIYNLLQGKPNENLLTWRFPAQSSVGFAHLQYEKDKFSHQGKEYAFIGFDEATQFLIDQIWYLYSRNRTVCGVRPVTRMTCNPDPDHEIKEMIRWWLDAEGRFPDISKAGVMRWFIRNSDDEMIWHDDAERQGEFWEFVRFMRKEADPNFVPTSLAFIPSGLDDNPILLKSDPGYKAKLFSLPKIERMRLMYGDWLLKPAAGLLFKEFWFPILHAMPGTLTNLVRYWDRAATKKKTTKNGTGGNDPDYTAGVLMGKFNGGWVVLDVCHFRGTPADVKRRILSVAESDRNIYGNVMVGIEQDPSQAGIFEKDWYAEALAGFNYRMFPVRDNKLKRAEPASALAENGKIYVMRNETWNRRFFTELEEFPFGTHDDIVDALSGAVMASAEINDPYAAWA